MSIHNMLFFERLWLDEPHERARGLDANHFLLNRVRRQTTGGVRTDLRVARDTTRSASHNVSSTLWVRTVRASKIFMAHNSRKLGPDRVGGARFYLGRADRFTGRDSCPSQAAGTSFVPAPGPATGRERPDPREGTSRGRYESQRPEVDAASQLHYDQLHSGRPNGSTGMDRHHDSTRKV
jgi:hypothetical protein